VEPPPNGRIIRNLILGSNYIQSHILHFFHLAALDYVQGPDIPPFIPRYEGDYRITGPVADAVVGRYLDALTMRRKAHEMCAIWGGRMPHQQAIVPGGVTEVPDSQKIFEFKVRLKELTAFVNNVYIPTVEAVAEIYSDWFSYGKGCMNMLSYGGFPLEEGSDHVKKNKFFKSGVYVRGQHAEFDPGVIEEEVKYSWFENDTPLNPQDSTITPAPFKKDAYTWLKAPRYNGEVMEVGPLARLWVMEEPSVKALGTNAFSVLGRHYARAVETKMVAEALDNWVMELEPGKPVSNSYKIPSSAQGMGLVEAPRGALGHWNNIEHQRTKVYNAIVPSTWNMSPRDGKDQMGPLEQALIGTPVADTANPIEIVRVVRSFDPCLACAIHIMTPDKKVISQFQIS